jgi:dTDP-4-dehydrorhamnose 3,5-epimerase
MIITSVRELELPGVLAIRFKRFRDERGWFTEHFRRGDIARDPRLAAAIPMPFVQGNESRSRAGVLRGLHLQWNPWMGKLVRIVHGDMVDLFCDIRPGSPTLGRVGALAMSADPDGAEGEWIWVPPGYAHGCWLRSDATVEYLCTGEYSPRCEAGLDPLSATLDWSGVAELRRELLAEDAAGRLILSAKDRAGLGLPQWLEHPGSRNFHAEVCDPRRPA